MCDLLFFSPVDNSFFSPDSVLAFFFLFVSSSFDVAMPKCQTGIFSVSLVMRNRYLSITIARLTIQRDSLNQFISTPKEREKENVNKRISISSKNEPNMARFYAWFRSFCFDSKQSQQFSGWMTVFFFER